MKILNGNQIAKVDRFTIENEAISSVDLMKRAANSCSAYILENTDLNSSFDIFCGVGNNGGDGLVIALDLLENGKTVNLYIVDFTDKWSDDFKFYFNIVIKKLKVKYINDLSSIPVEFSNIIIDAIFGVGLNRPAESFVAELISGINKSKSKVFSIDMPSGLYADQNIKADQAIVKSDITLTFQVPKLNLLLPNYAMYSGEIEILDIGLSEKAMQKQDSFYWYISRNYIDGLIKNRSKFSHKGNYGHSLLIGGSKGKVGAIALATKSAVKAGSGLVSVLVPECAYSIIQTYIPEAMVLTEGSNHIEKIYYDIDANAIGIGPGFGTIVGCKDVLKNFLEDNELPLVLDADAINIVSNNRELLNLLPENTILTPHPKEFERLVGKWETDQEKLKLGTEFAINFQTILVLKGAHTAIFAPDGNIYFNSTGNQGMASGGSGDVLTGIITAFLAQKYTALEAAILGVYIHGKSADLLIENKLESYESLSASNIIDNLGKTFIELKTK